MKIEVNTELYSLNPESFTASPVNLFNRSFELNITDLFLEELIIQKLIITKINIDEHNGVTYFIKLVSNNHVIYENEKILKYKLDSEFYFLSVENARIHYLKEILKVGAKLFSLDIGHFSFTYSGQIDEIKILSITKNDANEIIYEMKHPYHTDVVRPDDSNYFIRNTTLTDLIREIKDLKIFLSAQSAIDYYQAKCL